VSLAGLNPCTGQHQEHAFPQQPPETFNSAEMLLPRKLAAQCTETKEPPFVYHPNRKTWLGYLALSWLQTTKP